MGSVHIHEWCTFLYPIHCHDKLLVGVGVFIDLTNDINWLSYWQGENQGGGGQGGTPSRKTTLYDLLLQIVRLVVLPLRKCYKGCNKAVVIADSART